MAHATHTEADGVLGFDLRSWLEDLLRRSLRLGRGERGLGSGCQRRKCACRAQSLQECPTIRGFVCHTLPHGPLEIEYCTMRTIRVGIVGSRFAARFHWEGLC